MTTKISKEVCNKISDSLFEMDWKDFSAYITLLDIEEAVLQNTFDNSFKEQLGLMQLVHTIDDVKGTFEICIFSKEVSEMWNNKIIFYQLPHITL